MPVKKGCPDLCSAIDLTAPAQAALPASHGTADRDGNRGHLADF